MQVRVATLNAWALPPPLADDVPERMSAIAAELQNLAADVVSFQEVWTAGAREPLLTGAREAGLAHVWHNHAAIGGGGLVVASRHPIESARFRPFALRGRPDEIGGDFYGGKGFVELVIRAPRGRFALVTTHLQARYAGRVEHEYRALRTGQIVQLALASRAMDLPLVVTGDFNFRERDPGHRVLTGLTGLRDVAAELDRRQPTVDGGNAYRSTHRRPKRIDYVFARDGATRRARPHWIERAFDAPLRIGGRGAAFSDHAGLLSEIEFTDDASASPGRPSRDAIALAHALLAEGRADARRWQRGARAWAGVGLGGALLAGAGTRGLATTRRGLLRGALRGVALAALAPTLGLSLLSEVCGPDEVEAFDALEASLAGVGAPGDPVA